MAEHARSLDELLEQLSEERSLRGRVRVLGRSWKLLRSLAPEERERVALRVGSSWVWKRLEKSFLADGSLSENEGMVKRVLERMGDADPSELRDLAATLRRGDREELKDLMLMTLEEALQEEAEEAGEALPEVDPTAAPVPAPPETPSPAAAVPGPEPREPAPPPHADETPAPAQRPRVAPPPAPPPSPSRVVARATPHPAAPPRDAADELRELSAVERLRVLRSLHREPERADDMGGAGRLRLIERLGPGWAARKALSQMIRNRNMGDLAEALDLVARLDTPVRKTWCLSELLEHWELDDKEVQRVLDAAPTESARRRLARRQHRSAPAAIQRSR